MNPMTYEKSKVLERLRENRTTHAKTAQNAQKKYKKMVIDQLQKTLALATSGADVDHNFLDDIPKPMDFTENYDRVIDMLESSAGSEVVLSEAEFNQYMRDEWHWKQIFATSTAAYQ